MISAAEGHRLKVKGSRYLWPTGLGRAGRKLPYSGAERWTPAWTPSDKKIKDLNFFGQGPRCFTSVTSAFLVIYLKEKKKSIFFFLSIRKKILEIDIIS